ICNLFNPVTQIIAILKLLGLDYYHAFIVYMVLYFWLGTIGFYLLAKEIFQNRYSAYLAYLALLFSSLGVSMFTQLTLVEIVVPTIWFFYFLCIFARAPSRGRFLGLTFSLMMALSSYLPFYFVTVLGVFFIAYLALFFRQAKDVFQLSVAF